MFCTSQFFFQLSNSLIPILTTDNLHEHQCFGLVYILKDIITCKQLFHLLMILRMPSTCIMVVNVCKQLLWVS